MGEQEAWEAFEGQLQRATDLHALRAAHDGYVADVARRALLGPHRAQLRSLVDAALQTILDFAAALRRCVAPAYLTDDSLFREVRGETMSERGRRVGSRSHSTTPKPIMHHAAACIIVHRHASAWLGLGFGLCSADWPRQPNPNHTHPNPLP